MIIRNARVFIDGKFNECDVRTENGLITEIGKNLEGEGYDRKGQYLFAGFIDTHFHGACNVYCGDSLESMREIARTIPQYGVTSYVPTPIAKNDEETRNRIRTIRRARNETGARVAGIFLYTDYKHRSIPSDLISVVPTKEDTLRIADGDLSDILAVLYAPELDPDCSWTSWLRENGVLPLIGFTEGTGEDVHQAVKHGARLTDHFPNGFPLLDHHKSTAVTQCLLEKDLYMQLNGDCIHVSPQFITMILKLKGDDHVIGVSDSSPLMGKPEGEYMMGDKKVFIRDGAVRDVNGKLVTGCHTFDENMRTMYANGFSLETIGKIFTENAAEAYLLKDRGKIEVGRKADLVVMDQDLYVTRTMINGEWFYIK